MCPDWSAGPSACDSVQVTDWRRAFWTTFQSFSHGPRANLSRFPLTGSFKGDIGPYKGWISSDTFW